MSNKVLKSGMIRLYLMFFILMCLLCKSENTFAQLKWQKENLLVTYDENEKFIIFDFIVYDYKFEVSDQYGYLVWCHFKYSEDDKVYINLMAAQTTKKDYKNRTWITMRKKKPDENIRFLNCVKPAKGMMWLNDGKDLKIGLQIKEGGYSFNQDWVKTKKTYLTIKWQLAPSCKPIKYIKIKGMWKVYNKLTGDNIEEKYTPIIGKSNSYSMIKAPSVLESEICTKVMKNGESDAITVTGAEPGKSIKVYTISGTEVKSVVVIDDVVNIKLPKNQIYFVKVGESRYKVAL